MVVWYHLWLVSGYTFPPFGFAQTFVQSGFLGVDLFFFLSGFCVALPYARARARGGAAPLLAEFARKRARKIVPSYLLALGVFAVAFHDRFGGPGAFVAHLVAHAAFVHVFFPATFGSFSGPLWTLAVEVQFYVLFAAVAPLVMRRPLAAYVAFVAVATAYRAAIAAFGIDDDFGWINQLPAVLDVFGAGVFGAFVYAGALGKPLALGGAVPATFAAVGGLLAIVAAFIVLSSLAAHGGDAAVHRWINAWRGAFGPVLLAATLGLARGPASVRACIVIRPLCELSLVSYGAYLFNLEIVVGLARLGLPAAAVFWLGAVGTLAVAALVTYGFERPIQRTGLRPALAAVRRWIAISPLVEAAEVAG
jgi:peptidoglycan/LPS O-acetylase OafA/YrhL